MKITKIKIENFRGYKEKTTIKIDNLSVFVGKNDIGKSTILEALDVFFNDKDAVVKIDSEDLNKQATEEQISISVCFSNYPQKMDIDEGNPTTLKDEYLLNTDNELEIKKTFEKGKLKDVYIVANHPNNNLAKDLLENKILYLKNIVRENGFSCQDERKKAELRKSIRDNSGDLQLTIKDIPVKKFEDDKRVWEKLQSYMPLYTLFQSDRSNKEILKDKKLQTKFKEIAEEVKNKTQEIAS